MIKNLAQIELNVADKTYRLVCDQDSPINAVKEALFQFSSYVARLEEKIAEDMKKVEEEKAKVEVVPEEVVVDVN